MHFQSRHILHYLILLAIIFCGYALLSLFSYAKNLQFFATIGIALVYVLYGLLHHHLEHDLTIKIVVEYVLVALLVVVLFLLVFGGR